MSERTTATEDTLAALRSALRDADRALRIAGTVLHQSQPTSHAREVASSHVESAQHEVRVALSLDDGEA